LFSFIVSQASYWLYMIHYELAEDIGAEIKEIIRKLDMTHIDGSRVVCVRSRGSASRRTLARCHGLPRIMQLALDLKPHYVIEIISEQFDKLGKADQTKVLIHELMHIPHAFGGGFRSHRPYVTKRKVEKMYQQFLKAG
jgi:predicted metallopeptidase